MIRNIRKFFKDIEKGIVEAIVDFSKQIDFFANKEKYVTQEYERLCKVAESEGMDVDEPKTQIFIQKKISDYLESH